MWNFIKYIFEASPKVAYSQLVAEGSIILDVRTATEFEMGHISGAINLPLHELEDGLLLLDKNVAVIVCCSSGIRSAAARQILLKKGFCKVINGGEWVSLLANL